MFDKIKEYFFKKKWNDFKLFFVDKLVSHKLKINDLKSFNIFSYKNKFSFAFNNKVFETFSLPRRFRDERLFNLMQQHMDMIAEKNRKKSSTSLADLLSANKEKKD